MKKFVVISVNENPEYQFYVPLVVWAWNQIGWIPIIQCVNVDKKVVDSWNVPSTEKKPIAGCLMKVEHIAGYGTDTVAQIARLYAACKDINGDSYIMTSDADMLPLSDYWKFDPEKITVWGHDLTGYQHMPICYIGMKSSRWREVMGIGNDDYNSLLKRDLDSMPNAKSEDQVKRWVVDQDLITDRINAVQFSKEFVHRGVYPNGYPVGRVDRSAWTKDHGVFIDAHLPRGIYHGGEEFAKLNLLLHWIWPNEDMTWFYNYTAEFAKIVG